MCEAPTAMRRLSRPSRKAISSSFSVSRCFWALSQLGRPPPSYLAPGPNGLAIINDGALIILNPKHLHAVLDEIAGELERDVAGGEG